MYFPSFAITGGNVRVRNAGRALLAAAALGTALLSAVPAAATQQASESGATASSAATPEIAGGTPAPEGAYPFAVKFTMTNIPRPDGTTYNSACSGALVSRQWVLTAGHCFHDVNRNPVSGPPQYQTTATIGKTDLSDSGGHVVSIVDVKQAPKQGSTVVDVALAKLATPVDDVQTIPISLATPTVGETLRLAGWGATTADGDPETHLQTGQFTVSAVNNPILNVVGKAPNADTSACPYDSGAPYFLERPDGTDVLISVESNGPDCPHTAPEDTVRVDAIANWIRAAQLPLGH
jgi:secreted trypsin-like serine protease